MSTTIKPRWMNEEITLLQDLARGFMADNVSPNAERWRACGSVDRDLWRKAGAVGLLGSMAPEALGGSEATYAHEAAIFIELGRTGDASWGVQVHNIALHYILRYGTPEQQQRWVPELVSGNMVGAIAMTEPGAGSDLQGIKTKATKSGSSYIVTGSKTFITNGGMADLVKQ